MRLSRALSVLSSTAGRQIGLRWANFAFPIVTARGKSLSIRKARATVGKIIQLALFGSSAPVGGCDQYPIEEQKRVAILSQQVGKHRPAPQQCFMSDFESSNIVGAVGLGCE